MKTVLITLLLITIPVVFIGQTYLPFLEDGKVWTYQYYPDPYDASPLQYQVCVGSDTVVGGATCMGSTAVFKSCTHDGVTVADQYSFGPGAINDSGVGKTIAYIDGIWYNLDAETKQAEVTTGANFDPVLRDETDGATVNSSTFYTGSVDIPASVTYNGVEYSVTGIGKCAFMSCI